MADAAPEASDAFAGDVADLEEAAELIRCDWCDQKKPSYEVLPRHDLLLCEDCRECAHDERTDRQIALMRGK